jgi:hypothetical protein
MARQLGQNAIPLGGLCYCNTCKKPLAKTSDNFFFRRNGNIQTYTCKPCYNSIESKRVLARRKQGKNIVEAIAELRKETLLEKVNTRTFPKGHPMNPTKEQRAALIDQINAKRYYKDENLYEVPASKRAD